MLNTLSSYLKNLLNRCSEGESGAVSKSAYKNVASPPITKDEKVKFRIDIQGKGLEIGPSYSPFVPKSQGFNVEILDHATAPELKEKYKNLGVPDDKLKNIEEVDYVWSGESLVELTGKQGYYDYIIASHVVEHTPDLVSFLSQCQSMLNDYGVLSLAVPDKRYCFDCLRPNTTTGDVIQAYYDKRTPHTPAIIFDHFSTAAFRNGCLTWAKGDESPLAFAYGINDAMDMVDKVFKSDVYIDVHNWIFVPQSFKLIIHDLNAIGLIELAEDCFFDTEGFEFYVSLKKGKDKTSTDRMSLAKDAAIVI
jgi:predicted SAM-dependent methyltransferase